MPALPKKFYINDTLKVAKDLLGAVFCRNINGKTYKGIIVETEAYTQEDPACHAYKGITKRTQTMYREGGISYVYFTYGMHHCMNIVTEQENRGCAVLIRALEPITETLTGTNGPSRLCKMLDITRDLNGIDITSEKSPIWIEKGKKPKEIVTTTRIGIREAADYPWRFYIKDNKWVSKK